MKRKIVSRLTDEVDVVVIKKDERFDKKIAILSYKDRKVIIEKSHDETEILMFMQKNKEYVWGKRYGGIYKYEEFAIEEGKNFIKDDNIWNKM